MFILVFFQLLCMCEIFSCEKLKEKKMEFRTFGGQSELLSPGGARAFQIKLNKQTNSLLTINWIFI